MCFASSAFQGQFSLKKITRDCTDEEIDNK